MTPVLPVGLWLQAFGFALAFLAAFALVAHAVDWLWPRCRAVWRSWRLSRDLRRWSASRQAAARLRRVR